MIGFLILLVAVSILAGIRALIAEFALGLKGDDIEAVFVTSFMLKTLFFSSMIFRIFFIF